MPGSKLDARGFGLGLGLRFRHFGLRVYRALGFRVWGVESTGLGFWV